MSNPVFRQPRESRLIAGLVILIFGSGLLFFTVLVALESFSESPIAISLFLMLSVTMNAVGLYFAMCVPTVEVDISNKLINVGKSCLVFQTKKLVPFSMIKEVGIKELYHAGDHTEESGTSYYVEIRGKDNLEVPGTKSGELNSAGSIANDIAGYIGIKFNPAIRKVFTGSFKIK